MESLAGRTLAAMAISIHPTRRCWRKKNQVGLFANAHALESTSFHVRCVAVPVREDFADEEDYVKAGGSELLFVQMQQNKTMDHQSKLADKLPRILTGGDNNVLDLVVIGCGPAGLALAAESAKLDLGLECCIEHVWRYTIVYLDDNPIYIGRAYGRVSRHLLHEELLKSIGAASGKLLEYEVGGPRVSVQTAYGIEVEMENNPYDPSLMVFMDYRDYWKLKVDYLEAQYPTFLYAMPMSPTRVFFEEWSYIPVGGSLPNTEQRNLAFGAAASMVHPATGYSVVRSLSEAPQYASVIANILRQYHVKNMLASSRISENISMQDSFMFNLVPYLISSLNSSIAVQNGWSRESSNGIVLTAWNALWPQERKRQRAFFLFGLALILQLDIEGIRTFFHSFFRLRKWMSQGWFLESTLSSGDLLLFALYMFVIAPNEMRKSLINHLISDPTGGIMVKTYLTL
ncbi:hypothetical protein SASPL_114539 [Salvia splendens]|uniref:Lycopene epsilon-cyclase n=1 Tax=Salvia splendens TaxID=180675 RepID=A0A8X8Y6M3_SALSN|nr:hypothetical protein SASPL_114539 [Salvia splendens]